MSAFLQDVKPLSDEELQKLGIKVWSENIYIFLFMPVEFLVFYW